MKKSLSASDNGLFKGPGEIPGAFFFGFLRGPAGAARLTNQGRRLYNQTVKRFAQYE
jgi:hypothetical protein